MSKQFNTQQQSLSLWDSSAEEADYQNPFCPDEKIYDLVIVGGGFTGLSAAYHASKKGLSTYVIESVKLGYGGSGRNVGLVNAGTWLPPGKLKTLLGVSVGARFLEIFSDAPRYVFELIEKNQIRCELTRTGTIHAAHSSSGFKELEMRFADWKRLGAPVELLSKAEVSRLVGSSKYQGGLLDNRAGTINPMGYCRGLARIALAAGAKISTGTPVRRLTKEQNVWHIETDQGNVQARAVFLGTNAYTDQLWPGLNKVFSIIEFLQVATKPLGNEADDILPNRQGLWTTARIMFSLRKDMSNRLIVGSMGRILGQKDGGISQRWARKQLSRLFPDLGSIEFEEAWHGKIAMTPDHLPRIHELEKGLYTAIGYNGRGITTGTIFGKAMADFLCDGDSSLLPLPISDKKTLATAGIASKLFRGVFVANQIFKSM